MDQHAEHGEQEGRAEKFGRAEDAHLRRQRFEQRQPGARRARASRPEQPSATRQRRASRRPAAMPHGTNSAMPMHDVGDQLQARRPFDQRQMPRRVFEDHRLVDHRELEVRGRVVDRDARVLREQAPSGTRRRRTPGSDRSRTRAGASVSTIVGSEVERLMSEAVNSIISIAGSARKPIIISRRAPSVPNAVPMSIAGERR